jgi:hypothetical protein
MAVPAIPSANGAKNQKGSRSSLKTFCHVWAFGFFTNRMNMQALKDFSH